MANLATLDVMNYVTQVGVAENKMLMWEYDPTDPKNRVLGGQLDVIAVIRTLAIKVCSLSVPKINY